MATGKGFDSLLKEATSALKVLGKELKEGAAQTGEEVKASWNDIQPKLKEVEQRLKDGAATVGDKMREKDLDEQVRVAVVEAKARWKEVEPKLQPVVDGIAAAADNVGQAVSDTLAGMNAEGEDEAATDSEQARKERIERIKKRTAEHRQRLESELGNAGQTLEEAASVAVGEMRGAFERLRERLGNKDADE